MSTAHLLSEPDQISPIAFGGERRVVTIMFADISGFTALSERMDPEVVRDLMNGCFDQIVPIIEQYGGFVDKFIGDAVMALFGAPNAHENDPERAMRAALAVREAVARFSQAHQSNLDVHIGINTGLVVAGGIGSAGRQSYSVLGDAVNLAARLEDASARGEILVGPDTYRAAAPLFEFAALAPTAIKGRQQPLPIYRLIGLRNRPGRVRGIEGAEIALVGREAEQVTLSAALDRLLAGQGHAVALIGEAGLGKSRLIAELRSEFFRRTGADAESEELPWVDVRAISYRTARPYSMFQSLVREISGIPDGADEATIRHQLELLLGALTADREGAFPASTFAVLQRLLGVSNRDLLFRESNEEFRREVYEAVIAIGHAWAAKRPVVLVLDDLHWADQASVELFNYLINQPDHDRPPFLLIAAFRPDRGSPAWMLAESFAARPDRGERVVLSPLASAQIDQMIDQLLERSTIPPQLRAVIQEKAEGNPFFVEELVRELIQRGILHRHEPHHPWQVVGEMINLRLPESLNALLATRIDRLGEGPRQTLQAAAAIGRTFSLSVLQRVSEAGNELDAHLRLLEDAELISLFSRKPEQIYVFHQALTQEAAYYSTLVRRRRALHAQIAETLISLYPDRLNEIAASLVHHFREGGDLVRALSFAVLSGDEAFRLFALVDAVNAYRAAFELAWQQPYTPELGRMIEHVASRYGRALELSARFPEAMTVYYETLAQAEVHGDRALTIAMKLALAVVYAAPTPLRNPHDAVRFANEVIDLATLIGDEASQARALWALQLSANFDSRPAESQTYGLRALEIAQRLGLRELIAYVLNDLSLNTLASHGAERARELLSEANTIWRELRNLPMLVDTLSNLSIVNFLHGEFSVALQAAEEGLRLSRLTHNNWGLSICLARSAYVYLEYGAYQRAVAALDESRRIGDESLQIFSGTVMAAEAGYAYSEAGMLEQGLAVALTGATRFDAISRQIRTWPMAILARIQVRNRQYAAAQATIASAYALRAGYLEATDFDFGAALLPVAEAELAYATGDDLQVLALAERFIALCALRGIRQFVGDMQLVAGQSALRLGRQEEGFAWLHQGLALAEQLGSQRMIWRIAAHLANAYLARADLPQAAICAQQAAVSIDQIRRQISDPTMLAMFEQLTAEVLGNQLPLPLTLPPAAEVRVPRP